MNPEKKYSNYKLNSNTTNKRNTQVRFIKFYCNLFSKGYFKLSKIFWLINRIIFSCDVFGSVSIGDNFKLKHFGMGVVIHPLTTIGNNVKIYQQVTIGVSHPGEELVTTIKDNVTIGAGAKILGNGELIIGANSIIGANAVVLNSIPDNAVVVGNPAKIIKINGQRV